MTRAALVVLSIFVFFIYKTSFAEVAVGDTPEQVIQALGNPISRIESNSVVLFYYQKSIIKIVDGRVASITVANLNVPRASDHVVNSSSVQNKVLPVQQLFPSNFVGNPEFDTILGKKKAGTAFLVKRENDKSLYILTVRHLLGPDGGFEKLTPQSAVPAFVQGISLNGLWGGVRDYDARGLSIPAEKDVQAPLYDLAIFQTTKARSSDAAALSSSNPAIGEIVWLVARVRGGVPAGTYLHRAKVVEVGHWLICEFDNRNIVTNGASGGPVLNTEGKVVGIYSGHSDEDGRKFAFVIPCELIQSILPPLQN